MLPTGKQRSRNLLRLPYDLVRALMKLRQHHRGRRTVEETVSLALNFQGKGYFRVMAAQVPSEIMRLAKAVEELDPRVIVEIGTAEGSTLLIWAHLARTRVITCDIKSLWIEQLLFRHFPPGDSACKISFLSGNSHDRSFRRRVEECLNGEPIDFLFIDGDHTEAGVEADYRLYRDLVRPGGLIAFHDIVRNQPLPQNQVYHFWKRVKEGQTTEEYVQDHEQVGYGIGVIRIPER